MLTRAEKHLFAIVTDELFLNSDLSVSGTVVLRASPDYRALRRHIFVHAYVFALKALYLAAVIREKLGALPFRALGKDRGILDSRVEKLAVPDIRRTNGTTHANAPIRICGNYLTRAVLIEKLDLGAERGRFKAVKSERYTSRPPAVRHASGKNVLA